MITITYLYQWQSAKATENILGTFKYSQTIKKVHLWFLYEQLESYT